MFLIDTNRWIQLVRRRAQANEVRQLLAGVAAAEMATTDYSVHGVGIIMLRYGIIQQYQTFLNQLSIGTAIRIVGVPTSNLDAVANACTAHRLDFDDAYQYAAAETYGLTLISLDAEFDRTPRGRLTPAAALARYGASQQTP